MTHPEGPHPIFQVKSADLRSPFGLRIVGVFVMKRIIDGQKFQKVENDENRFFAITSSKLFKN